MRKAFQIFDPDDIGCIDIYQFKGVAHILGEEMEAEQLDTLFEVCDQDHSGTIEIDEVRCKQDVVAG